MIIHSLATVCVACIVRDGVYVLVFAGIPVVVGQAKPHTLVLWVKESRAYVHYNLQKASGQNESHP